MNSPHKGQWRGAYMFALICVWINGSVNNREAGDSRRHRAHYDVIVMQTPLVLWWMKHSSFLPLKRKYHGHEIFVSTCTADCQNDNFRCNKNICLKTLTIEASHKSTKHQINIQWCSVLYGTGALCDLWISSIEIARPQGRDLFSVSKLNQIFDILYAMSYHTGESYNTILMYHHLHSACIFPFKVKCTQRISPHCLFCSIVEFIVITIESRYAQSDISDIEYTFNVFNSILDR